MELLGSLGPLLEAAERAKKVKMEQRRASEAVLPPIVDSTGVMSGREGGQQQQPPPPPPQQQQPPLFIHPAIGGAPMHNIRT